MRRKVLPAEELTLSLSIVAREEDASRREVRRVPVETRDLVVVPADQFGHDFWCEPPTGSIVWVEPPAEAEDVEVEAYRRRLLDAGALAVKVLPRPAARDPLPRSAHAELPADSSVRAVVAELVGEVEGEIREEVRGMVEAALAKAGL